jgi:gliding motility-associated lipoprotein GldB
MKIGSFFVIFLISMLFLSCGGSSALEKEIADIQVAFALERFDQIYYETPVEDFSKLRKEYSVFFPEEFPDSIFVAKLEDPLYRELYDEVQLKYKNFTEVESEIEDLFRHIKYYFPEKQLPKKVTTIISEMDYVNKVIYTDSVVLIAIDLYLGEDHKFYEFPNYFRQTFTRRQILPDMASAFAETQLSYPNDRTLLAQMIYFGKQLYVKELLIPSYTDAEKIGYTEEQWQWCLENEKEMWRYFIEESLLYNTDGTLLQRFIAPAPFSKFYLEIDNESPGRVGVFLGWQIVRSYMNQAGNTLENLLNADSKSIFEASKYKPKR